MQKLTLGSYLKSARQARRLSRATVAEYLKLESPFEISAWERNEGAALPLPILKALIPYYGLDERIVFDLLLHYQLTRLEEKMNSFVEVIS